MAKSSSKSTSRKTTSPMKLSQVDIQAKMTRTILKVRVFTPICKPLNGSLPSSNASHLLKLTTFNYQYNLGKETKTGTATAYLIKGLRGALRHQVMTLCNYRGLDICHSSDKETDKQGNSFLPEGFHLLGSCLDKNECIVHSVFGSKAHKSKIRISSLPIANIKHKTYQTDFKVQNLHIATENHVAMSYDGKSIQNFSERYFAGEFEFEVDVSKCTAEETGMIIEAVMYIQKLGGGESSGYGKLQVKSLKLVKSVITRKPHITQGNEFIINEQISEETIPRKFTESLNAWNEYLTNKVVIRGEVEIV